MVANAYKRATRGLWPSIAGGACMALVLAGCLTIEEMAPPVGPAFSTIGMEDAVSLTLLRRGRNVYLSDCTRCHAVEPIDRYSTAHWRAIIKRMRSRSKLDDSQTAALEAYVYAAHTVLTQKRKTD